jgi:putative transposase
MMQWLLTSYVRYYNKTYQTSGHLWQGRYKSFIVQQDAYLLQLIRYVDQNPARANLQDWHYGSQNKTYQTLLDPLPLDIPDGWSGSEHLPIDTEVYQRISNSVVRSAPYGEVEWVDTICKKYDLYSTIQPRGRPKKA